MQVSLPEFNNKKLCTLWMHLVQGEYGGGIYKDMPEE